MADIIADKGKFVVIHHDTTGENIGSGLTEFSIRIETKHVVNIYNDVGPIPSSNLIVLPPQPIGTELGEWIPFNRLYSYVDINSDDRQVISRQDHYRTQHNPEEVPALFNFIGDGSGDWIDQEWVEVGWIRKYDSKEWFALQSHTSQTGQEPPLVPSLWEEIASATCEEWVQPTGGHDAYNIGDCAIYETISYLSTIDANTTVPIIDIWGYWELKP